MNVNYAKLLVAVTAAIVLMGMPAHASEMDDTIESSAKHSYVFTTYLKDDAVDVQSTDGVVTLTGTVNDASHKSLAENTVIGLPGVKSVVNKIEYKGDQPPADNSDTWISMQIKASLFYNRNVSGIKTQVFVNNGMVTLKGEADSQAQKDLTTEYAKDVNGVKEVDNQMTIVVDNQGNSTVQSLEGRIDDASVTAQVKMAFLVHHSTSAFKTGVSTSNGVVTLTGEASSDAGKEMAAKVAEDINGVKSVINNMTVGNS